MFNIYKTLFIKLLYYLFNFILVSSNFIFFIIYYYLKNLEDEMCNCVRDWRHDFIKYMSIILIFPLCLYIFNINILNEVCKSIFMYLLLIYIYVFNTYIEYLNTKKCNCAVEKQKILHSYLMIIYYIVKVIIYLLLLLLLLLLISQLFLKK